MTKQENPHYEDALQEILNPESGETHNAESFTKKKPAATHHPIPQAHSSARTPPKSVEVIVRIIAALFVVVLLLLFAIQIAGR